MWCVVLLLCCYLSIGATDRHVSACATNDPPQNPLSTTVDNTRLLLQTTKHIIAQEALLTLTHTQYSYEKDCMTNSLKVYLQKGPLFPSFSTRGMLCGWLIFMRPTTISVSLFRFELILHSSSETLLDSSSSSLERKRSTILD